MPPDPFEGLDLEAWVTASAQRCGLELADVAVERICAHAREVLRANRDHGLTRITDPRSFRERHIGEALQGAALIAEEVEGVMLDLGSGNGYPGLVVAAARPNLRPVLAESSQRKATFLGSVIERLFPHGRLLHRHVQRAEDLAEVAPVRVIVTRAMGGWERIVPKLVPAMTVRWDLLLWGGAGVELVARRAAWTRRLRLGGRTEVEGRASSWIWQFRNPDA